MQETADLAIPILDPLDPFKNGTNIVWRFKTFPPQGTVDGKLSVFSSRRAELLNW